MTGARTLDPVTTGTVIQDRFEIRQSLGKGGMGEVFLAYDRSTRQLVALKIVREDSRMPGDDEALRQELLHARSVGHPNVCRVHDLTPSRWGSILVMEHLKGLTLHTHVRRTKAKGGYTAAEFRKIAMETCAGLAAIHGQDLVHGDLKPGNVMVTEDRAIILDFGFAQERARVYARRPGAPPDGGTPNYMAPERLQSGGASAEDDVYALGLTLWEMWTCKVPEPGARPRSKRMREQIMFDVPSLLSVDEVKQVFRCLSENPRMRPPARHLRFFNPARYTVSPVQVPRDRLDPGAPPARGLAQPFAPGSQALLVTYATNTPDAVGRLFPLLSPQVTLGRREDQDIVLSEPTVSGLHATMNWNTGTWLVSDAGSTNGTYVDHSYDRKNQAAMIHGGEIQLGELRLKLVTFKANSPYYRQAQLYLKRRDGLTGLLVGEAFLEALDEEGAFADWAEVSLTLARYDLLSPNRSISDRPTILELLALRRAAQRCVELTEALMLALHPVTAGRTGTLSFVIVMVGLSTEECRTIVEQVASQAQAAIPERIELRASLIESEPGRSLRSLID